MPKDFLALDTNFPQFTGTETTEQKVNQLYNYTYMLLENLRYCLRNLDSRNFNEAGPSWPLRPRAWPCGCPTRRGTSPA